MHSTFSLSRLPLRWAPLALGAVVMLGACATSNDARDDDRKLVAAPIEEALIVREESDPSRYTAVIRLGLPSGCAAFERSDLEREGDTFHITVWNSVPKDDDVMCTMIYRTHQHHVPLPKPLKSGQPYSVTINRDTHLDFTPQ